MSPENVTRAAEEYSETLTRGYDDEFDRELIRGAMQAHFTAGAAYQREQHREVLIRLKHILERAEASNHDGDMPEFVGVALRSALAVIQKELAP